MNYIYKLVSSTYIKNNSPTINVLLSQQNKIYTEPRMTKWGDLLHVVGFVRFRHNESKKILMYNLYVYVSYSFITVIDINHVI